MPADAALSLPCPRFGSRLQSMEAFTPELWSNGVAVGVDKAHEVGGGSAEAAVAAEVAMIGGGVREEPTAGLAVGMPWSDCSGGIAPSGRGPAPEGRFRCLPSHNYTRNYPPGAKCGL